MSFDFPQQPRRRKKGGISGVVMLLVIGLALFVFLNMRGAGADENGEAVESGRPAENRSQRKLDPRIDRELQQADEFRRQRENILGDSKPETARNSSSANAMPSGRATGNADWSIDDVDNKKNTSPESKKTIGKDGWSLEEVPSKQKSSSGFEANKTGGGDVELTEKSDWSVEGVKPKTKKTTEGDWSVEELKGGGGN